MALRSDEVVLLKGREHPLYAGVLREAMENGLTKLIVTVLQYPSPENGNMAVCSATAVFEGADGKERVFGEVGDCDDRNCGSMIAPHKIRMAATRSKGRALRDALGIGIAMAEELGGAEPEPAQRREHREPDARPSGPPPQAAPPTAGAGTQRQCADCGCDMPPGMVKTSIAFWGGCWCMTCRSNRPRLDEAA